MKARMIDAALVPAFRPYLHAVAAADIENQPEDAFACGAVTEDGQTCGAAYVLLTDEGELLLQSLFVDPQVRRQGVATMLLDELEAQLGKPVAEAIWFASEEATSGIVGFLEARGFMIDIEEDSPIMQLRCSDMQKSPRCRRAFLPDYRPDPNVIPFSAITDEELQQLVEDENIPEALNPSQFEVEVLASPLSMAYRYQGTIAAYFLAIPAEDGAIVKAAVSREMAHGGAFFQLAYAAMHNSLPYLPEDGGCYWLEAVNEASLTMAKYLCHDRYTLWYEGYAFRDDGSEDPDPADEPES